MSPRRMTLAIIYLAVTALLLVAFAYVLAYVTGDQLRLIPPIHL